MIEAFTDLHGVQPQVTIEVVSDNRLPIDVVHYIVPSDFQTLHGALFKARALQYAIGAVSVAHKGMSLCGVWCLPTDPNWPRAAIMRARSPLPWSPWQQG